MPQKKGCIPWNKGLTKEKDDRIKSSVKKIYFSDQEKEYIVFLYVNKWMSPTQIGNKLGCSSHPIIDLLKSYNILKNVSMWRKKHSDDKKEKVFAYAYNGIVLNVINGYISKKTKKLYEASKIQVECNRCKKVIIIKFVNYKSKLKYNSCIYCNKCSCYLTRLKYHRNIKISSQQKIICNMIGAMLNYKISDIHVDMALENEKIIIEYDGWVWHGNKEIQKRDRKRDEYLKSIGWKILRIKSNRKIPDKNQIENSLKILRENKHTYTEIILDDWGKVKTIY